MNLRYTRVFIVKTVGITECRMNDKYQLEIDDFINRFGNFKDKRMALYGIGRYTATLLEGRTGFRFVGLMDKNPENIGKTLFGLPVFDQETAEKNADMVIINTSETYWDVIYGRIHDIKIPVFYKNGEKAEQKRSMVRINPFYGISYDGLCRQMGDAEIISFDFFDTLFVRCVCSPRDIFSLMEAELGEKWKGPNAYTELRNKAKEVVRKNYSLDELYAYMEKRSGLPHPFMEMVKNRELELEKRLLSPRREMISAIKTALENGKEVYIISDMYLPEEFYDEILREYGITIPAGNILISNVLDKSKNEGTLWQHYSERIVKGRKALHVGDSRKDDIENAEQYKLTTYHIPGIWDMLGASSMRDIRSLICTDFGTAVMGCVLRELFQNPFALERKDGKVVIKDCYVMGYCVFGPVILSFLLWLMMEGRKNDVKKMVFMSRDGYFLKEDFEYLCGLTGEKQDCCYLGISRQLAMIAAAGTREDLEEYISMPYTGGIKELFEDRFGIYGVTEMPGKPLEAYMEEYGTDIEKHIQRIKENYQHYIEQARLDDACAVVDLGYYGNNQRYLNKLAGKNMQGYYFNANLSLKNKNAQCQKMAACFQKKEDSTGENSQVLKRQIYLESFLTAPYGMVKAVDEKGNFICAEKRKNQEYFSDKVEMNRGVKSFVQDYVELFGECRLSPDLEFIDGYYGYCFSGGLDFAEEVKGSFYNDNAMMNRIESLLFY